MKQYLGFHSANGQVHPQIIKTAETAAWLQPKIKKVVRQFLELAVECRFVFNYSAYNSPLTDLAKKGANGWSNASRPFLRLWLCCMEVLHFTSLISCVIDKCAGGSLIQELVCEDRPVLYISRHLSMQHSKYNTIEKECLIIKSSILTLQYYLLGPFTPCLNHTPLQWLHHMKYMNHL